MADQRRKFLAVVPAWEFRALIKDGLNVIGLPMQEEALSHSQFVDERAVLLTESAPSVYHDVSPHRRNRIQS
jgi:hypothetical protein